MAACCPPQVVVPGGAAISEREVVIRQRDSVLLYLHDSVLIREKGDTVRIERWHTLYRDRYHDRFDTVRLYDSIAVSVPVVVEKPLTGWQYFQIWLGRILMAVVVLWIVVQLIKRYFKPF